MGGINYGDPDLTVTKNTGTMKPHEVERLRGMMIEMINKPGDFEQWLGRFATTLRHELDIAPPEPPYQPEEVLSALNDGQKLIRLSGLRVMCINEHFFVNSEGWITTETKGADALCQFTEVDSNELGEALESPAFIAQLTEFINQGYWYFEE